MNIDTSKPNISRVYDYVLGGHHNFEVDRQVAEGILKVAPSYPRWARLNRWFLQMTGERWADAGHAHILDLASGMPTAGHLHTVLPAAKIVYCDNDAMTAAYAEQVVGELPNVRYLHADVTAPEPILAAADSFFAGERQVAIGFIGIAYFLDDATVSKLAQALHEWSVPGSVMAMTIASSNGMSPELDATLALFKKMNAQIFLRSPERLAELMQPWQITTIKPLATWLNLETLITEEDRFNVGIEMYGALLSRGE